MNPTLPSFSQPEVLKAVGAARLSKLLSGFTPDLLECNLAIPPLDSADYLTALASVLSDPPDLPGRFRETLIAIEKVAVPEQQAWVRSQLAQLAPFVSFPCNCPLLDAVLEIWFLAPDHLLRFASFLPGPQASQVFAPSVSPGTVPQPPHPLDTPGVSESAQTIPGEPNPSPSTPLAPPGSDNPNPYDQVTLDASPLADSPAPAPAPATDIPVHEHLSANQTPSPVTHPQFPFTGASPSRYRIARLPEETRHSINLMLRDQLPYAVILENLGDLGKTLNKDNLSRWKKTGYQDWLKAQQKQQETQNRLQFLVNTLGENQTSKIHEASQQMAALQISELLNAFDPAALKEALQTDAASYVRLLTVLPKLSQGGLACERHRVKTSRRIARLESEKSRGGGGISPEALAEAERKLRLM